MQSVVRHGEGLVPAKDAVSYSAPSTYQRICVWRCPINQDEDERRLLRRYLLARLTGWIALGIAVFTIATLVRRLW